MDWKKAILVSTEDVTALTRRYFFEIPEERPFKFTPGQFITFEIPGIPSKKDALKSYSIANAPDEGNIIELVIVHVPGGTGTDYLFDEMKIGDTLPFLGPLGKFTLPEKEFKEICLVCTGTGIAPFRSMLLDMEKHEFVHCPVHLIFGTRTQADILYREEFEEMAKRHTNFHYHLTLSRAKPEWEGEQGYVHHVFEDIYHDKRPAEFFLCGWNNMVLEARDRLYSLGYTKDAVHYELYG